MNDLFKAPLPQAVLSPELEGRIISAELVLIGLLAKLPDREAFLQMFETVALGAGDFFTNGSPERNAKVSEAIRERIAFFVAASGGTFGR